MNKEIFKTEDGDPIVTSQKMGGYYVWSWKFPFLKFVKDRYFVGTKSGRIYELNVTK